MGRRWSATEIGMVTHLHLAGHNDATIAAALNELAEARDVKRTARQVYQQRRVAGLGIKWAPMLRGAHGHYTGRDDNG